MNKQVIAVIAAALLLFGLAIGGSLAFIGDGSGEPVHTLPGGQMHTGELETTTEDGGTMPGMTHDAP